MDKSVILNRLEMLVKLCEKTEPDIPTEKHLFTEHTIFVYEMMKEVRELHTGKNVIDPDSDRDLMINIMRQANKIWKIRNKTCKNGDNLMPPLIEAAKSLATLGEIVQAMKPVFGEWQEGSVF